MKKQRKNNDFSKDKNSYILRLGSVILLNLIGIAVCIYFLYGLNLIKIISVEGNKEVPSQEIIDASELKARESMFKVFLSNQKIENRVKSELPQINQITLSVNKFNCVSIKVTEFDVVGYIQVKDRFRSVLTNGAVDPHLKSKVHQNRPIFDQFSTKKQIQQIAEIYQKITPSVKSNISEIKLTHSKVNPNQITINMNDGNLVIGDLTTIQKKIADYSFLIKGKEGKLIIDLEVGVFVKAAK
ncbi:cell division protein FtsQ/DivIB [Xylocopilactobacillus apicola]|uniref:Cell division protein DivIB n=1 Tax=Xylocopilactobacillus apicola TaxID=2932184 RepID=A0AAU9DIR2_9LACO|nr:FtsQ-type POTRA domain-containing protein [Xylocopilactobacillus apicola]BDR58306.1 cell division protein DivIB [Xylocopilactobacillus apicola]